MRSIGYLWAWLKSKFRRPTPAQSIGREDPVWAFTRQLTLRVDRYCRAGTLVRLAEKADVSRNTLSALRNGKIKNPTYRTLNRIDKALLEFEGKVQ